MDFAKSMLRKEDSAANLVGFFSFVGSFSVNIGSKWVHAPIVMAGVCPLI
jgi:hypothetical protein